MHRIDLLSINQTHPGFEGFFSCWVCRSDLTVLVDLGPACSAPDLLTQLGHMGVRHVDYVLLTHIHIDHAGALGAVLERYPEARAVCHGRGLKFVVDPARLWEGSRQVLGELADYYGPPPPVDASRLIAHTDLNVPGLGVIETPGHAVHHVSYTWLGHLFAGEAAGNYFVVKGQDYLRPATPHKFFLPEALASVERMMELDDQPIHYAHAYTSPGSHVMLQRFHDQLNRWRDIVGAQLGLGDTPDLESRCVEALLTGDPELKAFKRMDVATRAREKSFTGNSVRGFLGFLRDTEK